jgi:SLT domain-containing protein
VAAEPIGSAYVIIRAITSQLAKDIKDGLDKGASDANGEDAGRTLGREVGESAGDEFSETWSERAAEGIEDSADSRDMRRATNRFGESVNERLRESFDRGGEQASKAFSERMQSGIEAGVEDVDVDRAAGSLGSDVAHAHADDYDRTVKERVAETHRTMGDDDSVKRGLSGFITNFGKNLFQGFTNLFKGGGGGGIGTAFGSFLDSIKFPGGPLIQWGVTLGLPALGAIAQTAGALIGSMISVLGFLGTAAAGAGVAFAGLGAAIAPAFFILKSAFTIESDDLEAFNLALEGTKERWQEVGLAAQKELLPALSEVFIKLEDLIPMFTEYAGSLGAIVGDVAVDAADALTREDNKAKIQSILDQGLPIIESLGDSLVTMIDPILSILAAAMPLAQRLADAIGRVADKFAGFIATKEESGELTETFDLWWDRLEQIGRIVGDLLVGLLGLFNTGADSATPFFDKLEGIAQRFRDFTGSEEGQNKLKVFFDNAWEVANEVFGLIGDIIKLIVGPMGETGGTEGIVNFFKALREDWLPAIVELGTQIGDSLKGPAGDFIDILGEFLKTLTESGAGTSFFQLFTANLFVLITALEIITNLLGTEVGGKIAKFALGFLVLAKTFKPILKFMGLLKPLQKLLNIIGKLVGKALVKGLTLLGKGFLFLGKAMLSFFVANPIVLLIVAIVAAITLLYFHFKPFRDFVDRFIIDPIQRLWEKIGGFQGIADFFKRIGEAIANFFTGIRDAFAAGGVGGVFDFLVEQLSNLGGLLATAGGNLLEAGKNLFGKLWQGIQIVWDTFILPFLRALPGNILNLLGDVGGWLLQKGKDLLGSLWQGIQSVWDEFVLPFFDTLPDKLLGLANFIVGVGGKLGQWGKDFLGAMWQGIQFIWDTFVLPFFDNLPDNILALANFILGVGGKLGQLGKDILGAIWAGIQFIWDAFVLPFFDNLPDTILALINFIVGIGGKFGELGKNILGAIWEGIKFIWENFVKGFFDNLPESIFALINFIRGASGKLGQLGKDLLGAIWDGITYIWDTYVWDFFDNLPDTILGALGTVADFGADLLTWGGELIATVIRGMTDWIRDHIPGADWLLDALGIGEFSTEEERQSEAIRQTWENVAEAHATAAEDSFRNNRQRIVDAATESGDEASAGFASGLFQLGYLVESGQVVNDAQIASIVNQFGDIGSDAGQELMFKISDALADNDLSDEEIQDILGDFEAAFGEAAGPAVAGFFEAGQAAIDESDPFNLDRFTRIEDRDPAIAGSGEDIVTQLATAIGNLDELMVPASNKLVDRVLLTLSRIHNEVTPKVLNPFILKMVAGMNKASELTVKAANKLVDKVMLTLSRVGNETTRTMNPFILRLVESMNRARDLVVNAANRLADGVLLTIGRIGNEVTRVLSPVAGRMTTVLLSAGLAAANSLLNGFKLGTLALIIYLQGLDEIIRNNVGDLSNVLFQEGKDLMNGLIRGVRSAVGSTTVSVPLTFAHGGLVPGVGPVPAIVHGGELILNAAQQAALGSNVTRWAGIAGIALNLAGQSQRWMLDLLTQMKHESGGNPTAINKWDINWRLGHPSMGLMQVIMPTFLANAGKLVKRGILDPLANIFAAIIYTVRRYGDLGRWRRGGFRGYSEGGIFDRPTLGLFAEAGREALIPLTQPSRALEIMRTAGLDSLVLNSQRDQNRAIEPAVTDVAMLRIDHAEIYDKVDVDIIAARIRRAYTSMGSRR